MHETKAEQVEMPVERLERTEERLAPRVRRADVGQVVVTKEVVEEPETVNVTLARDRVELERRRVERPLEAGEQPIVNRGEETVVLVIEERLEVRRVPFVVEEIHLRRQVVSEERAVTETVRKERFDVRVEGDVEIDEAH
ncbi:MAG TPA: DUF2382 domain-containing protein [Candidatus Limnocylindria bacterium]|nr:DUF2382 domain-containing protein [Candidatus Limnocylindria bacterium]